MDEDLQFLRAFCHQPDDALRLVYADWLAERGDPRAEFLRLDVELRRLGTRLGGDEKKRRASLNGRLTRLKNMLDTRWVWWMQWTQCLPAGVQLDLVQLADSQGLIEVRGSSWETVLLVEGQPIALNWNACEGSVGQYLVFSGYACGSQYVRQLRAFVAGEIDARPLADQLAPLLALFAPGLYQLTYDPCFSLDRFFTTEHSGHPAAQQELQSYYPNDPDDQVNLIFSQSRASLDPDRVAFYRGQIRDQQRPVVLTTAALYSWCEFVIDGHHKLAAYQEERVPPAILGITRWESPPISLEDGLGFLPPEHQGALAYRRMKEIQLERQQGLARLQE